MSDTPHSLKSSLRLGRRRFNQLITLTAASVLVSEIALPAIAYADDSASPTLAPNQEKYHIFIGEQLAKNGGKQAVTFKSGIVKEISIPKKSKDNTSITVKKSALDGSDAVVVLHTLYDPSIDTDSLIELAIASAPLMDGTRDRCRGVYQQVKAGEHIRDTQVLDVVDIVVSASSELDKAENGKLVQERYLLASQNSRLMELQAYIEESITQSSLPPEQQQRLKGIYQYVRANEPLPSPEDFADLTAIDAIVQGSALPIPIRQRYAMASAQTRAYTVDEVILNLIRTNEYIGENTQKYLDVYHQTRLGQNVEDQYTLGSLDSVVYHSDISPECKAIYKLARDQFFNQDEQAVEAGLQQYLKSGKKAAQTASAIVPTLTHAFGAVGVTAGTGTAIGTLGGAAATNATLAALGGGSVAAGGLGMLGGLAIATGGAALVGAAALVSVSLVAGMDGAELRDLGIAATTGTLASAAIVGTAWAAVSTFGAAGSLTGAAAMSTAMAALGGATTITGGAALIAFGVGLGVWQLLKGHDALAKTLHQVEPLLYTISDPEQLKIPVFTLLTTYLKPFQDEAVGKAYLAPNIPTNKLTNILSAYAFLGQDEKILATVDMSFLGSGKEGIAFTNRGIWWKYSSSPQSVLYSDPEYLLKLGDLPDYFQEKESQKIYELALKLGKDSVLARMQTL